MVKNEINTIVDWYPYVTGKAFFSELKNVPRIDPGYYQLFLNMLAEDTVAKSYFDAFELHDDFYSTLVDFNHFIPNDQKVEVFYAAKVGKAYREIPSFCTYVLTKAWEQCNGIPNLLLKVIPTTYLKKFCSKGYFMSDLTLHDAICNICTEDYSPFSTGKLKNLVHDPKGNFYELYIRESDMVAAVPEAIGESLTNPDIANITLTPQGLQTGGVYLRTMSGHLGAINSTYDLREVI